MPKGWNSLLDQLSTNANFVRLKEGTTKVRLVQLPAMVSGEGGSFTFWGEAESEFRGRKKTRYVMAALVFEGSGAKPEMAKVVTPLVVPKTVIKGILTLLAEDYELFDKEKGHGLSLRRTGSGLDTDYSVLPSRKPVPLPADIVMPTITIDEMAEQFEQWATRTSSRAGSGETSAVDDDPAADF